MQAIADELHESWINGNRTYVIDQVIGQSTKAKSALLSVLIFNVLFPGERFTFLNMLNTRVNK